MCYDLEILLSEKRPVRRYYMNPTHIAIQREAALAAEHMAIGISAIGKANYAQTAYYFKRFSL